jgi:hypothetical protein
LEENAVSIFKFEVLISTENDAAYSYGTVVNIYQTTRLSQLRKAQPRQSLHGNNWSHFKVGQDLSFYNQSFFTFRIQRLLIKDPNSDGKQEIKIKSSKKKMHQICIPLNNSKM